MTLLGTVARRRWGLPYTFPTGSPYNVPMAAETPTPDGSGQAMHPDVLDFGRSGWKGWRYWMAMTPLPNGYEPDENPCILVSNDGYRWQAPAGITNPVYPWPGYSYNADTELAYDPATSGLIMVWKGPDEGSAWPLLYGRSTDGVTWTEAAPLLWGTGVEPTEQQVSPAILRMGDGTWRMWTNGYPSYTLTLWTATSPEGPWGNPTTCTGLPPGPTTSGLWHMNVHHAPGGGFHMLYNTSLRAAVVTATSADGITWADGNAVIVPSAPGGWDDAAFHRSAFTLHDNGTHYRVWYSGSPGGNAWGIGYTQIPLTEWPTP